MPHRVKVVLVIALPALVVATLASIPAIFAVSISGWVGIALGFGVAWLSGMFLAMLAWRDTIPVRRLLRNIRPVGDDVQFSGDIWVPATEQDVAHLAWLAETFPTVAEEMRRNPPLRDADTELPKR